MSDSAAVKRQLTIKTGVVKRLTKEEKTYVKEAEQQQARVDKYVAEGKDEWDVKNQQRVLQDCLQMVPDCRKRLEAAVEDLAAFLDGIDADMAASEEANAAREVLQAAQESTSSVA